MKSGYDINRIDGDGYLIIPLSMIRLASGLGQEPKQCYEMLEYFIKKFEIFSNDVIFLYTHELYFNSEEIGFEKRKKLNQQIINHVSELRNIIEKDKKFAPNAVHYLPFDYVVLNSPNFSDYFRRLKKLEQDDSEFQEKIKKDMGNREYTEANVNFILEEVTMTHIVRQYKIDFPKTLVNKDTWRLVIYPGGALASDAYQVQNNILPQKEDVNPYGFGQYDYDRKVYCDYREIK